MLWGFYANNFYLDGTVFDDGGVSILEGVGSRGCGILKNLVLVRADYTVYSGHGVPKQFGVPRPRWDANFLTIKVRTGTKYPTRLHITPIFVHTCESCYNRGTR